MPRRLAIAPWFAALVSSQSGVFHREQAVAAGYTTEALRDLRRRGRIVPLLPNVWSVAGPAARDEHRLHAALLYGGPAAALDGLTALALHGCRYLPRDDGRVRLAVPAARHATSRGFVVVRHAVAIPAVRCGEYRVLAPADAAVTAGVAASGVAAAGVAASGVAAAGSGRHGLRAVRGWVAEVVQRQMCSAADLLDALERAPRRGSGLVRRAVLDVVAGVRAVTEAELRDLVVAADGLPEPLWNPLLRLPDGGYVSPDGYWEAARLVAEVDSREVHFYADGWERTLEKDARYAAAGLITVHVSPQRIRTAPGSVLRDLLDAYRAGVQLGPAPGIRLLAQPGRPTRPPEAR